MNKQKFVPRNISSTILALLSTQRMLILSVRFSTLESLEDRIYDATFPLKMLHYANNKKAEKIALRIGHARLVMERLKKKGRRLPA